MGGGVSANGALPLTEVRARAALALDPAEPGAPEVLVNVVDAVTPPVIMLTWEDPWLTPRTVGMGDGFWDAQLGVLCLAARLEPGAGVETLEDLVAYAIGRLAADSYPWPVASSQAPRIFEIGGVPLLGARLVYRVPVAAQ